MVCHCGVGALRLCGDGMKEVGDGSLCGVAVGCVPLLCVAGGAEESRVMEAGK